VSVTYGFEIGGPLDAGCRGESHAQEAQGQQALSSAHFLKLKYYDDIYFMKVLQNFIFNVCKSAEYWHGTRRVSGVFDNKDRDWINDASKNYTSYTCESGEVDLIIVSTLLY
jgi:hypothetical protein